MTYQAVRGISPAICRLWNYSVEEDGSHAAAWCAPDGASKAIKYRRPDKSFAWSGDRKGIGLYGQWLWRDGGRMVVVTEGEIDALSYSQAVEGKWPVVSVPDGAQSAANWIKKELEWLEGFDRVVFMFDMDEPGQAAAKACAQVLSPGKAFIARLPLKDANEMLQARRSKELVDAAWAAKAYRPDGVLQGEEVWDILKTSSAHKSIPYPHEALNAKTQGFRPGEVVIFTAGTGIGKSTFCRELAYYLTTIGKKIGYIALEENLRRTFLGLATCALDRPLHLEEDPIHDPTVFETFEKLKDKVAYYNHLGVQDDDSLFAKMRYMVVGLGCEALIFDHLSMLMVDSEAKDERRAIDSTMKRLVGLANETGAVVFVVSHLRKGSGGGRSHEEGGRVTLDDLRGSGGIKQMGYDIVALERDQQGDDPNTTTVRVLKCRHTGGAGEAGFLRYDPETGRLREFVRELEFV